MTILTATTSIMMTASSSERLIFSIHVWTLLAEKEDPSSLSSTGAFDISVLLMMMLMFTITVIMMKDGNFVSPLSRQIQIWGAQLKCTALQVCRVVLCWMLRRPNVKQERSAYYHDYYYSKLASYILSPAVGLVAMAPALRGRRHLLTSQVWGDGRPRGPWL